MDGVELQLAIPPPVLRYRSEPALRAAIAQTLRAHGIAIDEQVTCAAGAADIVTIHRDTIFEIKLHLTRKAIQQALGQLILYRTSLNPEARAILIGYATPETEVLRPHVEALGIEIICWQDDVGVGPWRVEEEAPTPPNANPLSAVALRWRVAEHAQTRGIASVRDLSFAMRANRQSLYPIWQGRSKSISLVMLGRLCQTLAADPGCWFRWHNDELVWDIQAVTEAKGMTMQDLVWAAGILPNSLVSIWHDKQQFVSIETLNKLARALNLATGDLFEWEEVRIEH
jgi:DNA-binding Xre family transcriptional regulator